MESSNYMKIWFKALIYFELQQSWIKLQIIATLI